MNFDELFEGALTEYCKRHNSTNFDFFRVFRVNFEDSFIQLGWVLGGDWKSVEILPPDAQKAYEVAEMALTMMAVSLIKNHNGTVEVWKVAGEMLDSVKRVLEKGCCVKLTPIPLVPPSVLGSDSLGVQKKVIDLSAWKPKKTIIH
jgi:hypothetical protein